MPGVLESKPKPEGLSPWRAARKELATHVHRWSQQSQVPEAATRILSEVVGTLFALEIVPIEQHAARFGVAIAKLDTASALLSAELSTLLANVRRQLLRSAAASLDAPTAGDTSAEPMRKLSVEVDEHSESNFFMGVDGLADGGIFVATAEPLPAGTKLNLHVQLPTAELDILGEVAWSRQAPSPGIAVRLDGTDLSEVEPVLRVMTLREPMNL